MIIGSKKLTTGEVASVNCVSSDGFLVVTAALPPL